MPPFSFIASRPDPSEPARLGVLTTAHGSIETPALAVPGAQGAVRSLQPGEVAALGGQVVACSTYHLLLRPGANLIGELGGLHRFMGWNGPIVADSGSVQIVGLGEPPPGRASIGPAGLVGEDTRGRRRPAAPSNQARIVRIDDDGVTFRSHIDGSEHRLTPASSIAAQERLGADVMVALDQPTGRALDEAQTARAVERSRRWAEQALKARASSDRALYGAVQGGIHRQLREASAAAIGALPFDGHAIGPTYGMTRRDLDRILAWTVPGLPEDRPRHLTGPAEPPDLFRAVARGIDTLESDTPARQARRGVLMTADGPLSIRRAAYREDDGPVDPACACPTCRAFSRAYLRHLFIAEELLAFTLAVTHNLAFVLGLMARIRAALAAGALAALQSEVLARYGR